MNSKKEEIKKLKLELMDRYVVSMTFILAIYVGIFTFFIPDKIMSWYLAVGVLFLGGPYVFIRKRYSPDLLVTTFLICVPIYSFYIILSFWENSVASFSILLPIPLGAYIYFSKKAVLLYTLYVIVTIITVSIVANNFNFNFPKHTREEIKFSDTLLFISNISIVFLLIHYKDKIKRLEAQDQLAVSSATSALLNVENATEDAITTVPDSRSIIRAVSDSVDIEAMETLFEKIEAIMNQNMLFKDTKLNLSRLSVVLDINSSYISKAIRYKEYPNFNTYLNIYRIDYVKKLLQETDFQKTTLMYVYTEAGFSNQSTFNRVFKQIEGITPSEYIQQNLKTDTNDSA
ncbi:helix-turn-helix domain-containing protein [Chryseobacterium pennipullorum]|uniref:HTH araC/xylS-type domain-containing protein n=1 Tax=Chryseobacterium pennipullorum TaxID=2258963 RepID=A0A3D9B6X0_9FLAO|nr:AraC family transcriptional regulator [Chryseobacterium pennipullorum]REC49006.1 hypothetical protein DRF67_05465 [Chryseobacterium pennipullorum]